MVFHHHHFTLRTSNTKQLSQIYLRTRHTGHRRERKVIATFIAQKRVNLAININDNHDSFVQDFKENCEGMQTSSPVVIAPAAPEKAPDTPVGKKMSRAMTKSLSMVTMKTNETTDKLATGIMKKTKSLRALRSKRKHSNEENMDKSTTEDEQAPSATEEKRPKIEDIKEPLEEAAASRDPNLPAGSISIQETALAKFAGVKNMLSSAVWGVPYAKVVEDPLEISVMDEPEVEVAKNMENPGEQNTSQVKVSEDNPANNCIIA